MRPKTSKGKSYVITAKTSIQLIAALQLATDTLHKKKNAIINEAITEYLIKNNVIKVKRGRRKDNETIEDRINTANIDRIIEALLQEK